MSNQNMSFRFEIDNFSEKKDTIFSRTFENGGCEWCLKVYPKDVSLTHLSLYLVVGNPKSLPSGWNRSVGSYFVVLNQSNKELYKSPKGRSLFSAECPSWGYQKALALSKFADESENDKLIVEFYFVDGEDEDASKKKENTVDASKEKEKTVDASKNKEKTVDIHGFQVCESKVTLMKELFVKHPNIANDLKLENQEVKTAYMNVLLELVKKLENPGKILSNTINLAKAYRELCELVHIGFKLDWLKFKLEELSLEKFKEDLLLSLEKKKAYADVSLVQKLDKRVKNLEKMELGSMKTKLDEVKKIDLANLESRIDYLERELENVTGGKDDDDYRIFKLEESVRDMTSLEPKLESLEMDLEKVNNEIYDDGVRIHDLEKSFLNIRQLEDKLYSLEKDLYEVRYGDEARINLDRIKQLEESVKNVEMLEIELDYLKTDLRDADEARVTELEAKLNYSDKYLNSRVKVLDGSVKNLVEMVTADGVSRLKQLEETVKNMANLECKVGSLERDLEKVSAERDDYEAQLQQLVERVKKVDYLETKLEDVSLESKISADADASRVKQLEETVKNLVQMVSYLKVELEKKKDKSSQDGFLLVD